MIWRCVGDFFKVLLQFKMATFKWPPFLGGVKTQKNCLVHFFSNFNIPSNMGMCKWFFKDTTKFKIFCGRKNSKTYKSEIIQILLSHSPRYGDAQVFFNFFKVLLKFKMAAMDKLHFFFVAQKLKN